MKSFPGPSLFLITALVICPGATALAGDSPSAKSEPATTQTPVKVAGADDEGDEHPAVEPAKPDPVAADYWLAIKLLGGKSATDVEAGRNALQAAADLEYTHAQVLLGNCHLSGAYGFPKNLKKAASLFRLAAERGNAFAKVSLGLCYVAGNGVRQDEESAVKWLTAAIAPDADYSRPSPPPDFFTGKPDAGSKDDDGLSGNLGEDPAAQSQATAHHLLGQILMRQKKYDEAQPHFVAAATAGNDGRSGIFQAAQQAALNYAFGQGSPRDMVKANQMLERARKLTARMGVTMVHNYAALKIVDEFAVADIEESLTEAGNTDQSVMQNAIAEQFANKTSKDYNPAEAVKWYELAAESGQVWAMLSLAFIYTQGDLGQPDPVKAFQWFEKAGGGDKPKHYLAAANLGICWQHGLGTAPDPTRAMASFQKHKPYDIVSYLGSIGHCPAQIVTFEQALALNQEWAQQRNDPQAQYLLAQRYENGWGVKSDQKAALKWLKKAADKKNPQALCDMGLLYETRRDLLGVKNFTDAIAAAAEYYRAGGEAGSIEAKANYANMLSSGKGVPRDSARAEALYLQCLETDPAHLRSHNNLAIIYQHKLAQSVNEAPAVAEGWRQKMLLHFDAAAKDEYPYALSNLADLYYEGKLVPRDLRKAMRYYEQLTNWPTHRKDAHFQLGLMHERGEGVPITLTEAAYHYRLAALDGHIDALTHLVNFYITGQGVSRDLDRAAFWLQYMARLGQPKALVMLCDILLNKKEFTQAVTLLKQLAENYEYNRAISGYANERLSLCYDKGYGVKPNPARATKYLKIAVEKGNGNALATLAQQQINEGKLAEALANYERAAETSSVACFTLGQMYFSGTHVAMDQARALQFLHRAAKRSNPDALYFLANLTWRNAPLAPALDEAIYFAKQAENIGYSKATELREKLEDRRAKANAAPDETTKARSS